VRAQLAAVQGRIEELSTCKQRLLRERNDLLERTTVATSMLLQLRSSTPPMSARSPPTPPSSTAVYRHPRTSSGLFTYLSRGMPRPLEHFSAYSSISVSDIAASCVPTHPSQCPVKAFQNALLQYRVATAAQLGLAEENVCWFVHAPFEVAPGVPLSLSSSLSSLECFVSMHMVALAMILNSSFHTARMEPLLSARTFSISVSVSEVANSNECISNPCREAVCI
jgi:hypothetical protein